MITITPSSPTANTPVTISVTWGGCVLDSGIQQNGTAFDVHFNYNSLCFGVPPAGTENFAVGTLAPGAYTVVNRTLVDGVESGQETTSFTVAAAAPATAIPALDPYGAVILATLVAGVAMLRFRRRLGR